MSKEYLNIKKCLNFIFNKKIIPILLIMIAVFSLYSSIYFLSYHIFFMQLPFEDIVERNYPRFNEKVEWEWDTKEFSYPGYAYFDGVKLDHDTEAVTMRYSTPHVVDKKKHKQIELFIKADFRKEINKSSDEHPKLRVTQTDRDGNEYTTDIEIEDKTYQRHFFDWETSKVANKYTLNIEDNEFQKTKFELIDESSVINSILFSSNIHISFFANTIFWFFSALVLFLSYYYTVKESFNFKFFTIAGVSLIVFLFIHSGAWVSNVYVSSTSSMGDAPFLGLISLFENGELPIQWYQPSLVILPAFFTWIIEGTTSLSYWQLFVNTFPTSRLIMFFLFFTCFLPLLFVIFKHIGRSIAIIFALITPFFYPFIVDLYNFQTDVFIVPFFMIFLALLVVSISRNYFGWKIFIGIIVTMSIMVSFKVTPFILSIIIPVGLIISRLLKWSNIRYFEIIVLVICLFISYPLASFINKSFYDGPRLAIPEENVPFAQNHLWEVIWAAYGDYDEDSAHGFAKTGSVRSKRISEATGFRPTAHIRHSQIAADEVYKPAVLNALIQTPNFFYSTMFVRHYRHGNVFFQYPRSGERQWLRWRGGDGRQEEIDNRRRNKMWKIAPLVLLTRYVQFEMSRFADICLICLATIGVFLIRPKTLIPIFFLIILAKYTSMASIHVLVRYFNFGNVVMLLTLSAFACAHFLWLKKYVDNYWNDSNKSNI